MKRRNKAILAAGMLAGSCALTGCASGGAPQPTPSPDVAQQQSAEPSPEASAEPKEEAPIPLWVDGREAENAAVEENGALLLPLIETGEGCGRIISKFCEGPGGNIWIGSDDGGLSFYNPRTGDYRHVVIDERNPALNIHALTVDGYWLWVGTYGNGLYRVDLRNRQVRHFNRHGTGLDNLDVYSVYRDSRGQLWIGTKMGICR